MTQHSSDETPRIAYDDIMDYLPPTKRMRLRSDTKRETEELQETEAATIGGPGLKLTDLPQCILLAILSHLTYSEVLTIADTCRRLHEACADTFDHGLCRLKPLILGMRRNVRSVLRTSPKPEHVWTRSERLLSFLLRQVNLVRAITFRAFFLADVQRGSGTLGRGAILLGHGAELLDEVYAKLEIIAAKKVVADTMDVTPLQDGLDRWLDSYHDSFEPARLLHPYVRPDCRSAMFGSRVVDLLECFEGCDRRLKVDMDGNGGWCRVKGTYTLPRAFFTCVVNAHRGRESSEPLGFREQRSLHDALRALVVRNNDHHYARQGDSGANNRRFVGLYQGTNQCGDGNLFFYGYFSHLGSGGRWLNEAKCEVTFHVDLVCRIELAPVEMLLAWREEEGVRREDGVETEGGEPEEGEQGAGPDLTLHLSIECPIAGNSVNRLCGQYSCLIQHKIQREDSTAEIMSPGRLRQAHERNLLLEQRVNRTRLQEYELPNSIFYV